MNTVDKFLKKIATNRDKLSKLEEEVLNYIIEQPEEIEKLTSEELSNEIFVSTATISRTCKKLGFSGYQELKYSLTQYRKSNVNRKENLTKNATIQNHLERFYNEMKTNISKVGGGITEEIIDLIATSNHVEFFGVGSSLPVCIEGARKMTFAGRIATARSDWDELRVVANHLTTDDLAIIVSLSGETLHIIEYANLLKNHKVPILSITGSENSQLERLSTHTLKADLSTLYFEDVDMSSRFPLNMIVDLLIIEYLKRK